MRYLTLAEALTIAEAVTGIDTVTLAKASRVELLDSALHAAQAGFGEEDFYPSLEQKAAVLCVRIARNHPLPDGNKRLAWQSLTIFLALNGRSLATTPLRSCSALPLETATRMRPRCGSVSESSRLADQSLHPGRCASAQGRASFRHHWLSPVCVRTVMSAGRGRWCRELVALRREDLTPEQLERQRALDRSWAEAQRGLADPEFRTYLEDSIRRLDGEVPSPLLTRDEFLAQTKVLDE